MERPVEGKNWLKLGWTAIKHIWSSSVSHGPYQPVPSKKVTKDLVRELQAKLKGKKPVPLLTKEDLQRIESIQQETRSANRNNVTRTQAYWDMYKHCPEIHWSHLAHMVSRNGGWNMTDLQGEMMTELLTVIEREQFFEFLELCNALIFQDAYPQLCIYRDSKRINKPLLHLLPSFEVSAFMEVFWHRFWRQKDSEEITLAMIINEQNYIEERVVQNPYYRDQVLQTWKFKMQSLLQMNHVFFPYKKGSSKIELAGHICRDFSSLQERISLGKRLYRILFHQPEVFRGVLDWANDRRHTGSRADYWPQLFSPVKTSLDKGEYKRRLDGCELIPGADKLYSPYLEQAWPNQTMKRPGGRDWFRDVEVLQYMRKVPRKVEYMMTQDYCDTLNTMEGAILLKEEVNGRSQPLN